MIRPLALLTLLATATACPEPREIEPEIFLQRMTAVPVGAVAEVRHGEDPGDDVIRLSANHGMGLSCSEFCPDDNQRIRCAGARVVVSPPELGAVHEAHLLNGQQGAVVIVGNTIGNGTVSVSTDCASRTYRFEVRE